MTTVRNCAFLLLCVVFVATSPARSSAATLKVDLCSIDDVTPGGCGFSDEETCYFEGVCSDGYCLDALSAAVDTCSQGPGDPLYNLENFDCDEPAEPPTSFSFWCDWHHPYPY